MKTISFATASASYRQATEDRAVVFERDGMSIVVVADGAGGVRGGAAASDAIVRAACAHLEASRAEVEDVGAWARLLMRLDAQLASAMTGETTALVVVVGGALAGVSAGDSEAWVVDAARADRLTGNARTERVGSGRCEPFAFRRASRDGVLIVATDGLFRHVDEERIVAACIGRDADVAARSLVELPRANGGRHPDDVAVVVVVGT